MSFLRKKLDEVEPLFHKGGKFEKWFPLFEMGDSFLYSPGQRTSSGPHVRDAIDLKRMMTMVVIALMPVILWSFFNNGYQEMLATKATGTTCQAAAARTTKSAANGRSYL